MNTFFTTGEGSILTRLLIAHCLSDFLFQPGYWIEHKRRNIWKSKYLWYHGLITGILSWLLLWDVSAWWVALLITISHILIDGVKLLMSKRGQEKTTRELVLFTADQLLHIGIIVLLWLAIITGWQRMNLFMHRLLPDYRILLRLLGYIIVVGPVGFFIHFLTRRWTNDLNLEDSLKDAGRWIGMLERVLIITFIYTNEFSAIGFLIAAKSVLRLTDKPERAAFPDKPFSTRKHTEYVLIGTFLSFAIAIITGLLVNALVAAESVDG
jgi:hypothetical protein